MANTQCYCGSGIDFKNCCEPYINGTDKATTAETLMRSRYSAYAVKAIGYLWETTAPSERKHYNQADMLNWAKSNHWLKLEILESTTYIVEFKAYYLDSSLNANIHHERSAFILENGNWHYLNGEFR